MSTLPMINEKLVYMSYRTYGTHTPHGIRIGMTACGVLARLRLLCATPAIAQINDPTPGPLARCNYHPTSRMPRCRSI